MLTVPSPDDLIESGLLYLWGPGFIAGSFLLLSSIASWASLTNTSIRTARRAAVGGRAAVDYVRAIPPARRMVATALTTVALALQALWCFTGFYVGNSISFIFRHDLPKEAPALSALAEYLRWDTFSVSAVVVFAAVVVCCWMDSDSVGLLRVTVSIPAYVYGIIAGLGAALSLVNAVLGFDEGDVSVNSVRFLWFMAIASVVFIYATRLVLNAPSWIKSFGSATP